jgi:hypothetical protein
MKNAEHSHISEHFVAQTGGYVMVDYIQLKDATFLGITDEVVVLYEGSYTNEDDTEENQKGYVSIYDMGRLVDYPEKNAAGWFVDPDAKPFTGHRKTGYYVKARSVITFDGIIYCDLIAMRNDIVLVIDDGNISVYETFIDLMHNEPIGIIARPCESTNPMT